MTGGRLKLVVIALGVLFAAATLLSWTQPWFGLVLEGGEGLDVTGQVAAPALSALGLASLALIAALSIAARVVRLVLGVVQLVIGALVVTSAASALADPIAASAAAVTDATALSGDSTIAALVQASSTTAWPLLGLVAGAGSAVVGLAVLATAWRWPGPTRRYDAAGAQDAPTTVGTWDSLSDGSDPTR